MEQMIKKCTQKKCDGNVIPSGYKGRSYALMFYECNKCQMPYARGLSEEECLERDKIRGLDETY